MITRKNVKTTVTVPQMLTNGLLGIIGNYIPTNSTVEFNRSLYNVLVTQNLNGKKSFNLLK